MYYKMKKIPESINIIIGSRMTNKTAYYEALNAAQESGKRMGYAQGREETAREILQMIYDKGKDTGIICLPAFAIKQLAKAYKIELE